MCTDGRTDGRKEESITIYFAVHLFSITLFVVYDRDGASPIGPQDHVICCSGWKANINSTGSGIATWVSGSSMNCGSNLESDPSDKEKIQENKIPQKGV